jgi:hypothetical protein
MEIVIAQPQPQHLARILDINPRQKTIEAVVA